MPETEVCFYCEDDGSAPVLEWLHVIGKRDQRAVDKCQAAIERLAEMGHELRRPEADILRDGIYELRIRVGRVNYRILYFYHGRGVALLTHGLTKEREVPNADIDRAIVRKDRFMTDPKKHTYESEDDDQENQNPRCNKDPESPIR